MSGDGAQRAGEPSPPTPLPEGEGSRVAPVTSLAKSAECNPSASLGRGTHAVRPSGWPVGRDLPSPVFGRGAGGEGGGRDAFIGLSRGKPTNENGGTDVRRRVFLMVGAVRFERTAPWSRTKCATRLRYAPTLVFRFCVPAVWPPSGGRIGNIQHRRRKTTGNWRNGLGVVSIAHLQKENIPC